MSKPRVLLPFAFAAAFAIFSFVCMFLLFVEQAATTDRAIKAMKDWKKIADDWMEIALKNEASAKDLLKAGRGWSDLYAKANDDFLVCNSMLPKEQRMR